ncbi:MAG: hypothetical protein AB7T06_30985 [Kofleriaceae bacterium]
MPTWDETREHLRTKYKLMQDDAAWVGLGFNFTIDGKQLTQRVRVEPRSIGPIPGLLVWCDVVEATRVPPQKALERNFAFPIGALAIHQGLIVLMATLPLESVIFTTLDLIIENLARDAAVLRDNAPGAAAS